MKKKILLFCALITSVFISYAQDIDFDLLHVQDSSLLNVNSPVREGCDVSIAGRNNPLFVHRTGTAYYTNNFLPAIFGKVDPHSSSRNVAVYGNAMHDGTNTTAHCIGVLGSATGNSLGTSYGVLGYIDNNRSGAAIYGSTNSLYGRPVHGRYAGFFNGNVHINGTLEATTILGSAATTNANSATLMSNSIESNSSESASRSISSLSSYTFSLPQPEAQIMTANQAIDDCQDVEAQVDDYYLRPHHGLAAEEVEEVYPELVYELSDGSKKINYIELIPILLQAINELQAEVDELKGVRSSTRPMKSPAHETTGTEATSTSSYVSDRYDLHGRRLATGQEQNVEIRKGQIIIVK